MYQRYGVKKGSGSRSPSTDWLVVRAKVIEIPFHRYAILLSEPWFHKLIAAFVGNSHMTVAYFDILSSLFNRNEHISHYDPNIAYLLITYPYAIQEHNGFRSLFFNFCLVNPLVNIFTYYCSRSLKHAILSKQSSERYATAIWLFFYELSVWSPAAPVHLLRICCHMFIYL